MYEEHKCGFNEKRDLIETTTLAPDLPSHTPGFLADLADLQPSKAKVKLEVDNDKGTAYLTVEIPTKKGQPAERPVGASSVTAPKATATEGKEHTYPGPEHGEPEPPTPAPRPAPPKPAPAPARTPPASKNPAVKK